MDFHQPSSRGFRDVTEIFPLGASGKTFLFYYTGFSTPEYVAGKILEAIRKEPAEQTMDG